MPDSVQSEQITSSRSRDRTNFRAAAEHEVSHPLTECADRGGTTHRRIGTRQVRDYYHRKQLKHARNAALVALTWAAVCVLVVIYGWVTTR